MAIFEEQLRAALLADAGVSALVGSQVHQDIAPENAALPCIVFVRSSSSPDEESYTFDGPGLYRTNITLSALAIEAAEAHSVADAIKALLNNFRGALTASQNVQVALLRDFRDVGFSDISPGYRWDLDFEFIHR